MGKLNKKLNVSFNKKSKTPLIIQSYGNQSLHTIDIKNPRSLALLCQAYQDIYQPAFPIKEERESLHAWLNSLRGKSHHTDIVIVLAGDNLDTDQPIIKGISVGYYYHQVGAGLLAYNAIDPAFRKEHLGRVMVEARKQALLEAAKRRKSTLRGVFLECNNPAKVSLQEDSFDPSLRIKIFEGWGAKIIPIDYIQPPLDLDADKCDKFFLMAYPHPETGGYPSPEDVRAFVKGIYMACAEFCGKRFSHRNPDYLRIMKQLDAMKSQPQPLLPNSPAKPSIK